MDSKPPPQRVLGGPPPANDRADPHTLRRNAPPTARAAPATEIARNATPFSHQTQAPPPPPQPTGAAFGGFQGARAAVNVNANAARRGWKPGRVSGRHDSPLYGKHRKRPSSTSIDSNVSWSGSEIESVGGDHQTMAALNWSSSSPVKAEPTAAQAELASAASLFSSPADSNAVNTSSSGTAVVTSTTTSTSTAVVKSHATEKEPKLVHEAVAFGVQPPKTPLGKPAYPNSDNGLSAAQRVRMGLSGHADSRAGSRANSSESTFVANQQPYDEKRNGPQSCPTNLNDSARQPQFSIDKLRQLRSNEVMAAKLLPSVESSVNSLMGYVRELQMSEASLRKQLVKTKQHTEDELTQSLSKVNELEKSMQEVERDREMARQKLEEQEQLIRDLAAKLKQAEAAQAKAKTRSKANTVAAVDELPSITEETNSHPETETKASAGVVDQQQKPLVLTSDELAATAPHLTTRSERFGLASATSPNRPLWDPWATGGATPMKNLPPVFNIASTGLDPLVSSATSASQTSTTDLITRATDYELKSVLMSPRREQMQAPPVGAPDVQQHQETVKPTVRRDDLFAPQFPAPVFNVGAMPPSPPFPQQQDFVFGETQNVPYDSQTREKVPLMESPSQATPMLPIEDAALANKSTYEQQHIDDASSLVDNSVAESGDAGELSDVQSVQAPSSSSPLKVQGDVGSAPYPISDAKQRSLQPPALAMAETVPPQHNTVVQPSLYPDSSQVEEEIPTPTPELQNVVSEHDAAASLPIGAPPPPPTEPNVTETVDADSQPQRPAPSAPKQTKPMTTEPVSTELVSLEMLLVDFFTEVDKKRLKMAKVYGKRYAGREKWLFAELTKRYGPAKVSELKARFENGSSADTRNGKGGQNHPTKTTNAAELSKAPRQGHPRHPQFFHPPTPATGVDLSSDILPGDVPPAHDASSGTPAQDTVESAGASETAEPADAGSDLPPDRAERNPSFRAARVSPRPRRSGGSISAFSDPPPPAFPVAQDGGGVSVAPPSLPQSTNGPPTNDVAMNAPPKEGAPMTGPPMNGPPPPMMQCDENEGYTNQPPFAPPRGLNPSSAAPTGLRQRRNIDGSSAPAQKQPEAPPVTLEDLLKELYSKHQPDKLKNVSLVAKQYAGKERELVGLLKGKYGGSSVKRLEENLEVLERAYRARSANRDAKKKRGCFVRTLSLLYWLSALLFFTFGAVFVSFVVLDARECRALGNDEDEYEAAEECAPLKEELESFTYERVGDYVRQAHTEVCFCSEWNARESSLLSNLSSEDLVSLARLLPFSPDSFGEPWIASVKEQVPSQEFYDSYAKPVVDLSLDVGAFVWSSVVELWGFDDAPAKEMKEVKSVPESDAVESTKSDDVGVAGVQSDVQADNYVETTNDVDAGNLEFDSDIGSEEREREREFKQAMAENSKFNADVESGEGAGVEANVEASIVENIDAEVSEGARVNAGIEVPEEAPVEAKSSDISIGMEARQETVFSEEDDAAVAFATNADIAMESAAASTAGVESNEQRSLESEGSDAYGVEEVAAIEQEESASDTGVDVDDSDVAIAEDTNEGQLDEVSATHQIEEADPVSIVEESSAVTNREKIASEDGSLDVVADNSDFALEEDAAAANTATISEESDKDAEDVIEMEVHQDGLDLSNPEGDTTDVVAPEERKDLADFVDEVIDATVEETKPVESVSEIEGELDTAGDAETDRTELDAGLDMGIAEGASFTETIPLGDIQSNELSSSDAEVATSSEGEALDEESEDDVESAVSPEPESNGSFETGSQENESDEVGGDGDDGEAVVDGVETEEAQEPVAVESTGGSVSESSGESVNEAEDALVGAVEAEDVESGDVENEAFVETVEAEGEEEADTFAVESEDSQSDEVWVDGLAMGDDDGESNRVSGDAGEVSEDGVVSESDVTEGLNEDDKDEVASEEEEEEAPVNVEVKSSEAVRGGGDSPSVAGDDLKETAGPDEEEEPARTSGEDASVDVSDEETDDAIVSEEGEVVDVLDEDSVAIEATQVFNDAGEIATEPVEELGGQVDTAAVAGSIEKDGSEAVVDAGAASVDGKLYSDRDGKARSPDEEYDAEGNGLASAVNEVLARLVEPFEARKTAAAAAEDSEAPRRVDDEL